MATRAGEGPGRPAGEEPTRPLTARQLEVLELMAKGLTNAEIGGVLGISAGTAKLHVSAVIAALGVTNRTEAAVALGDLRISGQGRAAPVPGFGERPAIAVLPFDNLGDGSEQDAFAEGLSEDLTTALAGWRWFPVIARNSAFAVRAQYADVKRIAAELGARYVIEGSTRRSGRRVRVHFQLIDGESGEHLLAERYDRTSEDVFALQDEIVGSIFGALEPALARVESLRARRIPPRDLTAWECFQRGFSTLLRHSRAEAATATAHLTEAVERAPEFAPAHAALSLARTMDALVALSRTQREPGADGAAALAEGLSCLKDALALGQRAVELDPRDAAAQGAHGLALALLRRLDEAEAAFRRSLDLNPSSAPVAWGLGHVLFLLERPEEALPLLQRALRLSPRDPTLHLFLGVLSAILIQLDRFEEALDAARRSVAATPPDGLSFRPLIPPCLFWLGREDEARAEAKALLTEVPQFDLGLVRLLAPASLAERLHAAYGRLGVALQ